MIVVKQWWVSRACLHGIIPFAFFFPPPNLFLFDFFFSSSIYFPTGIILSFLLEQRPKFLYLKSRMMILPAFLLEYDLTRCCWPPLKFFFTCRIVSLFLLIPCWLFAIGGKVWAYLFFPFFIWKKLTIFLCLRVWNQDPAHMKSPVCSRGQNKTLPVSVEDSIHSTAIEDWVGNLSPVQNPSYTCRKFHCFICFPLWVWESRRFSCSRSVYTRCQQWSDITGKKSLPTICPPTSTTICQRIKPADAYNSQILLSFCSTALAFCFISPPKIMKSGVS